MARILLILFSIVSTFLFAKGQAVRSCSNGSSIGPLPDTATNTTNILSALRALFSSNGITAYIIPAADEHQAEYVAPQSQRRKYVSGFSGSAGWAIVSTTQANLWTDGRYFLQAEMQLDCNWLLQKQGQKGVPSISQWVVQNLKSGDSIGIDPRLMRISTWNKYSKTFLKSGITLKPITDNLVDKIWTTRPIPKATQLQVLDIMYTGETWISKIKRLREKMADKKATVMVISSLDEVAWILCLRGRDIPFVPFFFGYVLVRPNEVRLYMDQKKLTHSVDTHLHPNLVDYVSIKKYADLGVDLQNIMNGNETLWLSSSSSYYLQNGINESKIYSMYSPVQLMKSTKNKVEIAGMKKANLKDAVAIIEFFAWLQKEIDKGTKGLTEISTSAKLRSFKSKQKDFVDLSFNTIAGFGKNGAIIHYRASNQTDTTITNKELYLVDSGCQFPDGTTDITRTVHFGTPNQTEKEAFTLVMMGSIELASLVFPPNTYGGWIDVLARKALWKRGLDYRHGTGHGIGHFLSVHEGPQRISLGKVRPYESPLMLGMVQSDEPGYYQNGKFGVRLETAILVVNATTKYNFGGTQFLAFESITLVPFQRKLINIKMLSEDNIKWLNKYNADTRRIVGAELKKQGKTDAYNWMLKNTEPIEPNLKQSNSVDSLKITRWTVIVTLFVILSYIF